MGKTPSRNNAEYWNSNEYKWISIADLSKTGKYIRDTKEHLSKQAIDESGIKLIPANTVIMSFKLSIGKTAITAEDMYSNEAIMAFHDKHVVDILPEYLFYMFKFKNWDEGSNKAVMGKTLNKATLSDVEIDVCSIEKQREIVDILNKIMNILENRDNEIVLLDNLIKARFVEMFGNARENPKGYKMVLFNDIVEYMGDIGSNGANKVIVNHLDMKDEEDYAMMVRFTNFTKNDFEDDVKFVSKEAYDFFKKSQIFGGELIICKIGSAGQNYVMRTSLKHVTVDKDIAGRYYQEAAVKAVCNSFDEKNRRKALLVMATGSGKTRTVIALCDCLLKAGWVKNILFLADRNSLVTQAKRSFVNMLPNLSCTNLVEEKDNYNAHCVFSTYQTMINCIDTISDKEGKLFTCGHFDLVICDEAHRSIYNKYRDIFSYFDAPLVGLTATPKDEIDKNTYEVFELENGVPTYGYDLAQAVKDGYLVDYVSVESKLKFIEQGIVYDELSEEDRKAYEKTFEDEHGELPEAIGSSALNTWIFNEDTIKHVLNILMRDGIKIDYGQKLGKTIIFAKNHAHAEKILEIFNKEYPHLTNYANVIDNYMTYAQSAIDEFSDPKKLPQIAISVDMLDTGIDVPDVLNLVFFKKVMSKAKFWQMIGRGTRLFQGLLDGEDKEKFYIFDFCGNFEFFRMNKGKATANMMALQGAIFNLKFEISYKLQDIEYQIDRLVAYRKALVMQMSEKVRELPRDNFAVRQHLKYVDLYSSEENYNALTYEDTLIVKEEVAPLILSDGDEASAVRFDALMYGIELAYLAGKKYSRARSDLHKKIAGIASVANIPEIQAQTDLINKVLNTDYVDTAGINEFEEIREKLRNLMKYLPNSSIRYDTNFTDEVLSTEWNESELENDDLKNYKAKAEYYIRQHQDNIAIAKLKRNKPLTSTDIAMLEEVLWSEVGTKQDYEQEFGEKPLGEFVREIVGLDMNAAKEAFSEYLTNASLDSRQIYFVNQIVEYIVHNGMMKDLSVLQESPFTDRGSVVEIFTDLSVWMGIRKVIDMINANAVA